MISPVLSFLTVTSYSLIKIYLGISPINLLANNSNVNRYLERKIVIVDPAIGRLRIGGRFTSSDPTDFLAALEVVLPVRARRDQQAHLLTAAE